MQHNLVHSALPNDSKTFRIMADMLPSMIWVSGTDMHCTFFNTSWLLFTGRTLEQERAMPWTDGVHRDERQRCLDTYWKAFHGTRLITFIGLRVRSQL